MFPELNTHLHCRIDYESSEGDTTLVNGLKAGNDLDQAFKARFGHFLGDLDLVFAYLWAPVVDFTV